MPLRINGSASGEMPKQIAVLAVTFLAIFTNLRAEAQTLKRIRIGSSSPSTSALPAHIAVKRGFFKEEGLDPEMITIRGAEITVKALLGGHLDYTTVMPSLVAAAVHGLPLRLIGIMVNRTGFVLISHPSLRSIQDLKGKRIGIGNFGAAADYTVQVALKKGGLDSRRDTTLLQIGGSIDRFNALVASIIQATVLGPPFDLRAEKMGYRSLLRLDQVLELPSGGYGTHESKLKENPDEIVRLMKATSRGIQFIKSQKEATIRFMMEWQNLDRDVAETIYPSLVESLADYGITDDSAVLNAVEMAKFQTRIDKPVVLDQIRDWSFAKKARDELLRAPPLK